MMSIVEDRRGFLKRCSVPFIAGLALAALPETALGSHQKSLPVKIEMFHDTSVQAVDDRVKMHQDQGGVSATVSEMIAMINSGIDFPVSRFLYCLTFDDRLLSQAAVADYLLKKNIKGTYYVMAPGWDGRNTPEKRYLKDSQIQQISRLRDKKNDLLIEIGCHTIGHPLNLVALRETQPGRYQEEIARAPRMIQELVGYFPQAFASPYSVYDNRLTGDLVTLGYTSAVRTASEDMEIDIMRTPGMAYHLYRRRVN